MARTDQTARLITTMTAADADRGAAVLTLAFSGDPAARWVYPDPAQYAASWPSFVRAFGGGAITHGSAYSAEECAGVALWLPPGVHSDEDALVAIVQESVAPTRQAEIFAVLGEQMGAYHPREPHWYLPLTGVDPSRQGRGVGSALLAHALRRCDQEQLPAYLEATSPRSRALYERFGFETVGVVQAGDSPPFYPMLRRPQPVPAS